MTKMAAKWLKSIPNLWPKRLKNHTLGAAHTYIAHIREYPPPRANMIYWDHTRMIIIILPLFKPMLLYLFNWAPPPWPSTASIEVLHMKAKIVKHHSWLSTSSQKYGAYNWRVIRLNCSGVFIVLAWAVWKVDNAIHQANHYPVFF